MAFAQNLKALRNSKGVSQLELSYRCNVERSQISRLERGLINCTISMLLELSVALEVDPKELLDFEFEK